MSLEVMLEIFAFPIILSGLQYGHLPSPIPYDDRLTFTNTSRPLIISPQLISKMWTPDVYFPTEKRASLHDITVPNTLMRVYPDGHVIYSMR